MSGDATSSSGDAPVAAGAAKDRPQKKSLLVLIATERQLLLIVLIIALIAGMAILRPDTFPRPANAAVVLLDTAQTAILACGMMVLMISGMFDLSIGGILAFWGIDRKSVV